MANIDQKLFDKVKKKTGLSKSALYARVKKRANTDFVGNDVALLSIAAEHDIAIQRHATEDQLAIRRGSTPRAAPTLAPAIAHATKVKTNAKKAVSKKPDNSVFVVHGRDDGVAKSMFDFLHTVGLNPIKWTQAIAMTKKGSPHVSAILDASLKAPITATKPTRVKK